MRFGRFLAVIACATLLAACAGTPTPPAGEMAGTPTALETGPKKDPLNTLNSTGKAGTLSSTAVVNVDQTSVDWLHLIPGLTGIALGGAAILLRPESGDGGSGGDDNGSGGNRPEPQPGSRHRGVHEMVTSSFAGVTTRRQMIKCGAQMITRTPN